MNTIGDGKGPGGKTGGKTTKGNGKKTGNGKK